MNRLKTLLGLCAVLILLAPGLARSAEIAANLQAVLDASAPQETIPVIVTFSGEADLQVLPQKKSERRTRVVKKLREKAEDDQRSARALLQARGKRFDPLWVVNGLAVQASPELIATLAALPQVERIEYDEVIQLPEVLPAAQTAAQWNIDAVHAPDLWALGYAGQGVTIAILDSGVNVNHPDLAGRYLGGPAGWYDPYRQTTAPYDPDGHGTLVAGIAVGGTAGGSAIGVAPDARWVAAKIFTDNGSAENSQILKAFQWLLDPDGNPATADAVADVVNNSWGFEDSPGTCDSLFRPAIQNLKAAGMAVVFSAGNTGPENGVSPANYAESFAVGATNRFSVITSFSGRGPSTCDGSIFPEAVAPGEAIRSTAPVGYTTVSGTSFSAPHVSGIMALLLSAAPGLPPLELERILKASANDLGPVGPEDTYGYGLVNALTALNLLDGNPDISVHDSAPPFEDQRIDFGHVPPGSTASRTITVRNAGDGSLRISELGTVQSPFAIAVDSCSGKTIAAGESCTVTLRFAPGKLQSYAAELGIRSSDPDQAVTNLQLVGVGNTPPPSPRLIAPAAGATDVAIPATLQWTQLPDANGDPISHTVQISERSDFSDSDPQQAGSGGRSSVLLAGAGGLLLFGLAAGVRRRQLLAGLSVAAALALLVACSGGGSDSPSDRSSEPQGVAEPLSETVSDLDAGKLYYWKVISTDARGARVESEVYRFTTRP